MLVPSPDRKEYPNTAISHAAAPQPPHALLKVLYKPGPVMAGMSVKMEVVRCLRPPAVQHGLIARCHCRLTLSAWRSGTERLFTVRDRGGGRDHHRSTSV
eukprot:COSAG01_NODE_9174_length_2529_cov_3.132099_2_plen_100_part_00